MKLTNSIFKCPKCRSKNYAACCPAGWWEVTVKSDPNSVKFDTKCYKCDYEGIIYMKGSPFKTRNTAAP